LPPAFLVRYIETSFRELKYIIVADESYHFLFFCHSFSGIGQNNL
jgi:hypothetical protein